MAASHQIKAIPQTNTYWKSSRKLAGSKFVTALMAARTVLLPTVQMYVIEHTQKNYNLERKVTGNKSGTAVTTIRCVLGHLPFCVLLKFKVVG